MDHSSAHCVHCGRSLQHTPLLGGADPPALCRLCRALGQLAQVSRQIDPQTWHYDHLCGVLEAFTELVQGGVGSGRTTAPDRSQRSVAVRASQTPVRVTRSRSRGEVRRRPSRTS